MFSDMVLYVKSYILRRVRKWSREVEHRFDYVYWEFGGKHGVVYVKSYAQTCLLRKSKNVHTPVF